MTVRHIDFQGVIAINKEIISQMGGKFAIINEGNLQYCVDSVMDLFNRRELINSCIEKAAYYIWCISTKHGFLDHNKRTAYQTACVFLLANGHRLSGANTDEVVSTIVDLATEKISLEDLKGWIKKHIKPISR